MAVALATVPRCLSFRRRCYVILGVLPINSAAGAVRWRSCRTIGRAHPMPNRILDLAELAQANELLSEIRSRLVALANGDAELLFAYRRKIAKQLVYDERSAPMARRRLKAEKRRAQGGMCAICQELLPDRYTVLDRIVASQGYTESNTRLICELCDRKVQAERRYA